LWGIIPEHEENAVFLDKARRPTEIRPRFVRHCPFILADNAALWDAEIIKTNYITYVYGVSV